MVRPHDEELEAEEDAGDGAAKIAEDTSKADEASGGEEDGVLHLKNGAEAVSK